MIPYRPLAGIVAAWAAITWGGRLILLDGTEGMGALARIIGSLLAAAVGVVLLWHRRPSPNLWVYSAVTALVWGSSLVSVWLTPQTTGFRLVHSALALVSLGLAAVVGLIPRASRRIVEAA